MGATRLRGGNLVEEGDYVLLYLDRKRTYLVKAKRGEVFHTHRGFIQFDALIGQSFGTRVKSSADVEFMVLKPTMNDYVQKIARRTQIMYPKDMAIILVNADIKPGSLVVEAGAGSGALTSFLANHVRPTGRVYSYEVREEFLEVARRNIERLGLTDYVELKFKDITQGIDESEVDAVVLDMATPWLAVAPAYRALRGSGLLASFSPTIDQSIKTVETMETSGFTAIETVETLMRRYQVKRGQTRPETLMIAHTGYLTFGRKILL
ncbi:MAG: tRNA (adenine-N1)-methyltransferase [Candidatus Bathyarchaeia archaeon]